MRVAIRAPRVLLPDPWAIDADDADTTICRTFHDLGDYVVKGK